MPRTPGTSPFTGQSLKGMELDVKLEDQGDANWACLFAATAFDVQVAAATTSRQHTLNKGSRTSTGAAGEITATADVFVVPDSPGQWMVNRAFETGAKINIRRCVFGSKVGPDITLSAKKTFLLGAASGLASGAGVPKAGGALTTTDTTVAGTDDDYDQFRQLMSEVEPGMTIQIDTTNYFVGYKDIGGTIYISPSPDDNEAAPSSLITGTNNSYPYIGIPAAGVTAKAVTGTLAGGDLANGAAIDSGTLRVYRGRVQQTMYSGTVTVPVVATDAAPGDDGNDLSTAQVSFALDDIGTPSYPNYA